MSMSITMAAIKFCDNYLEFKKKMGGGGAIRLGIL